jgi:hypothetical protein
MKVAVMHGNPLGALPTKPDGLWNRDMDKLGVGIGDSIESKRSLVGERNVRLFWSVISLSPEKGFPVLGEPGLREMGDSIDSASGSFQPAALCQPHENGIEDTSITGLLRGQ